MTPGAGRETEDGSAPLRTIGAIWTRDATSGGDPAGRPRLIAALRAAPLAGARHAQLRLVFACGPLQQALVMLRFAWGLLRLRPEPLQCLLFAAPADVRRTVDEATAGGVTAVYLDGIRCLAAARRLRVLGIPAVADLDDLMSRRCALQLAAGGGANLGYLRGSLPGWVARPLGWCGRLVLVYERWALRHAEREMVGLARAVTLLSPHEAGLLREMVGPALAAKVHCVPPPQPLVDDPPAFGPPHRFIFIGGERLTQNRLTIARLARLWQTLRPARTLHWYGRRVPDGSPLPSGMMSHGFVEDLAGTAYDGRSILLIPSGLAGGVKTKILEALANGCPVVGNPTAFEGLGWDTYPLVFDDADPAWHELIADPEAWTPRLAAALACGRDWLAREHAPQAFTRHWHGLLAADGPPTA